GLGQGRRRELYGFRDDPVRPCFLDYEWCAAYDGSKRQVYQRHAVRPWYLQRGGDDHDQWWNGDPGANAVQPGQRADHQLRHVGPDRKSAEYVNPEPPGRGGDLLGEHEKER